MEFNGFNNKEYRESDGKIKQKTKDVYLPLIDMHSAEYDTITVKSSLWSLLINNYTIWPSRFSGI